MLKESPGISFLPPHEKCHHMAAFISEVKADNLKYVLQDIKISRI